MTPSIAITRIRVYLFVGVILALLVLAACAPAATPLPPSPTAAATNTPQPTLTPTAQEPSPTASPATPLPSPPPAKDPLAFNVVAQMGGTFDTLAIDGNTVYLGIGARLATVDISDPAAPQLLWQSEVLPGLVGALAVQPGLAYLRLGSEMLVYDTSDPALPALVGKFFGVSGDLFAAGDFVYTFAPGADPRPLIAIDVSDPAQPAEAGRREVSSNAAIVVSGEVLYLASGGGAPNAVNAPGTLQLVDPADLGRTFSEIALGGASNYQVAVAKDFAFVVENRHYEKPDLLLVLDVSDPANPREVARREMDIEQTIDSILATDETLFLLSRSFPHSGCPTSLHIYDITDPASTQAPARFEPQSCFNRFAVSGGTMVATSERGLEVFDTGNPANIAPSGELAPLDGLISIDGVALNQSMAYLVTTAGRNRLQRLRVLDVASATPTLLNGEGLDLGDPEPSIFEGPEVRGDRLYGINAGVVDISDPASPRLITEGQGAYFYWPTPALVDNVLFTRLLDGMSIVEGLAIVDMGDPANPELTSTLSLEGFEPTGLSAAGTHLLVFSYKDFARLQVFDASDPLAPIEVGRLEPAVDLPEQVADFAVSGDTVYAAGSRDGVTYTIYALDISDPTHPAGIWRIEMPAPENVTKMVLTGDTVYLRLNSGSLLALNISDETLPYLAGNFPLRISDFAVDGDLLYLAAGDAGLVVLQVDH